jgi:hypothetical protein
MRSEDFGPSRPATFVKLGILREITGKKRNRVFVADEVLRLLEESLD